MILKYITPSGRWRSRLSIISCLDQFLIYFVFSLSFLTSILPSIFTGSLVRSCVVFLSNFLRSFYSICTLEISTRRNFLLTLCYPKINYFRSSASLRIASMYTLYASYKKLNTSLTYFNHLSLGHVISLLEVNDNEDFRTNEKANPKHKKGINYYYCSIDEFRKCTW